MCAQKSVLVGISGGINSLVTAYLLKRQGDHVTGLSLVFPDEEETFLSANKEKLESFFRTLDIPYHQIRIEEQYYIQIVDLMVAARISGRLFCPEVPWNNLLMKTLFDQMSQFKANSMATGHRVRLVYNHQTHFHEIYRSKEGYEDQSHLLAFLPRSLLAHLELPLMGMRRKDIEKIGKVLDIALSHPGTELPLTTKGLNGLLKQKVPRDICKNGEIIHHFSQCVVGSHEGIHHFSPGVPISSKEIVLRDESLKKKQLIPVQILPTQNQVVVMEKSKWVPCTHIILSHCQYVSKNNSKIPMDGCLKIGVNDSPTLPVRIRYLNNRNVLCELESPCPSPLFPGEPAVVYRGKEGDMMILGGKIFHAGHLQRGPQICALPPTQDQESRMTESVPLSIQDISSFKY